MNDGGDCRTAPATRGLLIVLVFSLFVLFTISTNIITLQKKYSASPPGSRAGIDSDGII